MTTAFSDKIESQTRGGPWCIIPARKGSKRLKDKNKLLINGKPLVQYAIEAAGDSEIFEKIIVTSDDEDILELAYELATPIGKYPILLHKRPKRLAKDTVQLRYLVQFLTRIYKIGDTFCLLIACNPFRTAEDLQKAWDILWAKNANYVMSVVRCSPPPQWALKRDRKGFLDLYLPPQEAIQQSQKLEPLYTHDGSFIFARTKVFLNEFNLDFHGSRCLGYPVERSVDIDEESDYLYAKFLMEAKDV